MAPLHLWSCSNVAQALPSDLRWAARHLRSDQTRWLMIRWVCFLFLSSAHHQVVPPLIVNSLAEGACDRKYRSMLFSFIKVTLAGIIMVVVFSIQTNFHCKRFCLILSEFQIPFNGPMSQFLLTVVMTGWKCKPQVSSVVVVFLLLERPTNAFNS